MGRRSYQGIRVRGGALLILGGVLGAWAPGSAQIPDDRFHISLSVGGYIQVGVGYTHWVEEHHALEMTLFPLSYPFETIPFGIRLGHAWIPSNERWRAKLGSNLTLLLRSSERRGTVLTPLLAFTPGLQYDPDDERAFRLDLWMSYYLSEGVFAPTALELLTCWEK